jgi:superfamily II DNA helicase RecQ
MKDGGRLKNMLKTSAFYSRLQYVVIDEAHCLVSWSTFRPDYLLLQQLRYIIPDRKAFYAASATLLPHARQELARILQLRSSSTDEFIRSNDRPNVRLSARFMRHPANSYRDLAFLTRKVPALDRPETFAVFFDTTTEAEEAALALRELLPEEDRDKIVWFHAKMSNEFRQEQVEKLKKGELWGICTTEAFGLVSTVKEESGTRLTQSHRA